MHLRSRLASVALLLAAALAGPATLAAEEAKEYPITAEEQALVELVEAGRHVKARELAQQILAANESSFVAAWAMAEVYEEGEGNLPRAHFYSKRAQQVLEHRWGRRMASDAPWRWHARVLRQLIVITRELDHQEEAVKLLEYRNELYNPPLEVEYGWPLMKLGRFEEARQRLTSAVGSEDPDTRVTALNTLGAMEDELDHPEESYRIFTALVEEAREKGLEMDVAFLRNAGAAAWGLLRFDEAERLLLEATRHFDPGTYSNPWEDLAALYIGQARFPEALAAVKAMHTWQHSCQPSLAQQRWAGTVATTALLFAELGLADEALALVRQALARPDRRAGTSVHADQTEAGHLVLYHHALAVARERIAERRCSAPTAEWLESWLASGRLAVAESSARRRAAALIVGKGRIVGSLRATAPDSIDVPDWLRPELNRVLGAGTVGAVVERLLDRQGPAAQRERAYLLLTLGESLLARGESTRAAGVLAEAAERLPRVEVLLRARCAALQALAAGRLGARTEAMRHFQEAYARHPGVLRALGLALPVRITSAGGEAAELAASWLADSPRFDPGRHGFGLEVRETATGCGVALTAPDGTVLRRVGVGRASDASATARALCELAHQKLFAPEIDLAQTDIASLQGSTLSGDTLREQLEELLGK